MRLLFVTASLTIFVSCSQNEPLVESFTPEDTVIVRTTRNTVQRVLNLDHGFVIEAGRQMNRGGYYTYGYLRLLRDDNEVMTDTSAQYQFEEKLYPMVIQKAGDRFEILLEVNNSPKKNYLHWLLVESDKLMQSLRLPLFVSDKFDINADGRYELAGFTEFHEVITRDNRRYSAYNPILYYAITSNGLELDSGLTESRNRLIYGDFFGYVYNENIEVPAISARNFDQEIRRIKSLEVKY